MPTLQMKRIYEPAEATDGYRVLVDRLWPRGMAKDKASLDVWAKDITPSPMLREAYHHGQLPWQDFAAAYHTELVNNPALPAFVDSIRDKDTVTLLFAAKDTAQTHTKVLLDVLKSRLS